MSTAGRTASIYLFVRHDKAGKKPGSSSATGEVALQYNGASLHNNAADQCIIYVTLKNQ